MNKAMFLVIALASILSLAADAGEKSDLRIAITFDDLPVHGDLPPGVTRQQVGRDLIKALKAAHAPSVYGFVNAVHLQNDAALGEVLSDWRAAGYPLGNHTWSHLNLNELSREAYTAEIVQDEASLQQYSKGLDWRWFRYPFLSEGSTSEKRQAIREVLSQRGYHVAAVTMSFSDYLWNDPYARCAARQDAAAIKLLEKNYLLAAAEALDHAHQMSVALYGRDIPYVLLMHVGAFDAHIMPQLLKLYRDHRVKLISLPQAEQDSYYASDVNAALPAQPPSLEARMVARGLAVPANDATLTVTLSNICK